MYKLLLPLLLLLCSCMSQDYGSPEEFSSGGGLFIVCEGNFQYGNASLSHYDPQADAVEQEVFRRANGMRLGDLAQSMTIHGGLGWIVVNNSHVVFAIDPATYREVGRIEGFTSPRYIHFVSDTKAYVSQIWDNRIFIVNPRTYTITGHIGIPGMTAESGSTEQMVQLGDYVYCNLWSYQRRIVKIDCRSDSVVGEVATGIQPTSLAMDARGKLWTLCDGGYEGSPYGWERASILRIDAATMAVEKQWQLPKGVRPCELQTNAARDTIYWIADDIWRMAATDDNLPAKPFIEQRRTKYYGLTVSPHDGDVYVADAIDYQQQGAVLRFGPDGKPKGQFYVGVIPGAFCWQ